MLRLYIIYTNIILHHSYTYLAWLGVFYQRARKVTQVLGASDVAKYLSVLSFMKAIWCPARHASNNDDCRNQFCNTCFLFRTCAPNFYLHGKASTVDASWMFQGGPDFGGALQYCLPLWDVRLPYSVFKHPFALFAGLQCIVTVCQVMSSAFATKSLTISHWQDSIFSAPPGRRPPAAQRRYHILYHICIWTWMSKIAGTQFCFVHSVQCHDWRWQSRIKKPNGLFEKLHEIVIQYTEFTRLKSFRWLS